MVMEGMNGLTRRGKKGRNHQSNEYKEFYNEMIENKSYSIVSHHIPYSGLFSL